MILYTDNASSVFGGIGQLTPAHTHVATTNFSNILDDISMGHIPCGSGQPFPVEWTNDTETFDNMNPPWCDPVSNTPVQISVNNRNPWMNM